MQKSNLLGERIEEVRIESGMSYRDLADRVIQQGGDVTEGTIRNLVRGTTPTIATLYSMALGLAPRVTFTELLELAGYPVDPFSDITSRFMRDLARLPQNQREEWVRAHYPALVQAQETAQSEPLQSVWTWFLESLFGRTPAPVFRGGARTAGGQPVDQGTKEFENRDHNVTLRAAWQDSGPLSTDLEVGLSRSRDNNAIPGLQVILYPGGGAGNALTQTTGADGKVRFRGLVSARPDRWRLEVRSN